MLGPNFNIWVRQLDDGWLKIYDGREVLATAWNLWSVRVFVGNYKVKKMREFMNRNPIVGTID